MAYERPNGKIFSNISSEKFENSCQRLHDDRVKEEMFKRHEENLKYVACMKECKKLTAARNSIKIYCS